MDATSKRPCEIAQVGEGLISAIDCDRPMMIILNMMMKVTKILRHDRQQKESGHVINVDRKNKTRPTTPIVEMPKHILQ